MFIVYFLFVCFLFFWFVRWVGVWGLGFFVVGGGGGGLGGVEGGSGVGVVIS